MLKFVLPISLFILAGCMTVDITCEGGNCSVAQSKNLPVVVGKDQTTTNTPAPIELLAPASDDGCILYASAIYCPETGDVIEVNR